MIKRFINWLSNLFKKEIPYKAVFINEIPNILNSKFIYIIQNEGYNWQAVMVCPCGCKKTLHMNLMKEHYPFWKIRIDNKNIISFNPSVQRVVGCKSHFYIKNGKIVWAKT